MQIAETSIRRPVFAAVLSLLIILIGIVSYLRLTVREYPKIENPVVTVATQYIGASSDVVESQVTQVIEDALSGIEDVDYITSVSRSSSSQVTVVFNTGRDADAASADVNSRVAAARKRLPKDILDPVVTKTDADAQPVIILGLSSKRYSQMELSQMADLQIKPILQNAKGAANIFVWGESRPSMQILISPEKLAGYGLTTQDIATAITNSNVQLPSGFIDSPNRKFTITNKTGLQTVQQFQNIVLRNVNGSFIRLRDVANVREQAVEPTMLVRLNGQPVVAIAITKQATANPLDLSKSVNELLGSIKKNLPSGVTLTVSRDSSVAIGESINSVYHAIGESVALVAIVIFLFLRTVRASIIPLVTIPVSLLGTFAIMLLAGFTINLLTLLALVLAVGLVVDDAIVMLENIYRHIEEGVPPFQAAVKGAREVGFAIVAMTLTLIAVYAPLAFISGKTGKLFTEFAFSLAGAVLVSGFVSLTLSPMMSSLLLKKNSTPNWLERTLEHGLDALVAGYKKVLFFVLNRRWIVVIIMVASAAVSWAIIQGLPSELAPSEDQDFVLVVLRGPAGSPLAYNNHYAQEIVHTISSYPEVKQVFSVIGTPDVSSGMLFVALSPSADRKRSAMVLAQKINGKIAKLPAVEAYAMVPPSLGGSGKERPLSYVILTNQDYPQLNEVVQKIMAAAKKNPNLTQLQTNLQLNQPQLLLNVNRDQAANLNVNVVDVARAVQAMIGSSTVNTYNVGGEQYDVDIQAPLANRNEPSDISGLFLRSSSNAMVPLSSLVHVENSITAPQLNHFSQRRSATISANLAPGYSLGQALNFMDSTAKEILPTGYSTDLKGVSRDYLSSQGSIQMVFAMALLFIFFVLSAQFESFIDPFIIMLSVPLSLVGALLAIKLSGGSLNIYSEIGMVTLVGLITKHGILIVEFANQLREHGMSIKEAALHSAVQRFRPILMTTGAMVLGSLPLALATGSGSVSRQQIGWVIVGGMSMGTLLTIFVVPTAYILFARATVPGANKTILAEDSVVD
jgi:multidrug efflux pump